MYAPPQKLPLPKIINLLADRKEERDVAAYNSWVADPAVRIIGEMEASLKKYPPIKLGTPDPYTAVTACPVTPCSGVIPLFRDPVPDWGNGAFRRCRVAEGN